MHQDPDQSLHGTLELHAGFVPQRREEGGGGDLFEEEDGGQPLDEEVNLDRVQWSEFDSVCDDIWVCNYDWAKRHSKPSRNQFPNEF